MSGPVHGSERLRLGYPEAQRATHQVGTVTLIDTISLAADQTKTHSVQLGNAAFSGGYGAIVLDSLGNSPSDVFQTYPNAN